MCQRGIATLAKVVATVTQEGLKRVRKCHGELCVFVELCNGKLEYADEFIPADQHAPRVSAHERSVTAKTSCSLPAGFASSSCFPRFWHYLRAHLTHKRRVLLCAG